MAIKRRKAITVATNKIKKPVNVAITGAAGNIAYSAILE